MRQEINDLNEPDPELRISPEQAPLVAAWIFQASADAAAHNGSDDVEIPIQFYGRGPSPDLESLTVFGNPHGMIVLKIDEDTFFEIAPAMAKRLRDQLSRAIREALTDMLRPDEDA